MFLKLAVCVYRRFDRPRATVSAHMKHNTEAAKACGIEARIAPNFPVNFKEKLQNGVKGMIKIYTLDHSLDALTNK